MQQFLKYAEHNKTEYASKICGIQPRKRHKEYLKLSKNIKAIKSDTLCGKICNMHTFEKYAKYAAIAYMDKTNMPNIWWIWMIWDGYRSKITVSTWDLVLAGSNVVSAGSNFCI